jgi:S-(hydroxymethyl)glutathione dehydrogenase/alcohol dehydrogenase
MSDEFAGNLSRRGMLRGGAVAVAAGGAAALLGGAGRAAAAESTVPAGNVTKNAQTWKGTKFRAYVRHDSTASVEELTLLEPGPRQIVVQTKAFQACYTTTTQALGTTPIATPAVPGHGSSGVVLAVGEDVRRFIPGDKVIVTITPQCGVCYNCLHGRSDMCQFLNSDDTNGSSNPAFAKMKDGREVTGGRAGCSEIMVANEEWAVPVFTGVDFLSLSLFSDVGAVGLGMPTTFVPVQPGSDVVVQGLGPIGLSQVNGAAIMGAGQIIAIDPIAYRRRVALSLGATTVIDPTGKDTTLVNEIRALTQGPTDRFFAGGRSHVVTDAGFQSVSRGPDFLYEAVGGDRFPNAPGLGVSPDPNGILPLQQIWDLCPTYGHLVTTSVGQVGNVTFAAGAWTNRGKTIHSAQYGGVDAMTDLPRFVRLVERGLYKAHKIATDTWDLDHAIDAFRAAASRSVVSAHVVFK